MTKKFLAGLLFIPFLAFSNDIHSMQIDKNKIIESANKKIMTPEMREKLLAYTGGFVQQELEGPCLVFCDLQNIVSGEPIKTVNEEIKNLFKIGSVVETKSNSSCALKLATDKIADPAIAAVIIICEDPQLPTLLIAPENNWAIINVLCLIKDKPSSKTLSLRLKKELWRTFAYLMGAANSNSEVCLMKSIFNTQELDGIKYENICTEPLVKIAKHIQKSGIRRVKMATYRKACEEGWAPSPTNDVQKTIWNEINK